MTHPSQFMCYTNHPPIIIIMTSAIGAYRRTVHLCTQQYLTSKLKLGLGAHKFTRMLPQQYQAVVQTALEQGVDTFDCPSDEAPLVEMIGQAVTVLQRVGYRTIQAPEEAREGDLLLEEQNDSTTTTNKVVHNLSVSYIHHAVESSALLSNKHIYPIPMVHNPEVHGADVADRLTEAFCGLEELVATHDRIQNFGVVSNGLSLPKDHPLYLDYKVVLQAADQAKKELGRTQSAFSIFQLPANLTETRGIQVAREIKQLRPDLSVYAMRPLTYYPDFGSGTGHGAALLDYLLPQGPKQQEWTHLMAGPPKFYHQVLNLALSHFDGEALLEAKLERSLTPEEEETLDGAKVLQSLLREMDAGIDTVTSFSQHEHHLMNVVIPTLASSFEELDEPSSHLLSNYFAAHGWTVRHRLATNTRKLLQAGGDGIPAYDIPNHVTLQEYALAHLFQETSFDKVIMGATQSQQIVDAMNVCKASVAS